MRNEGIPLFGFLQFLASGGNAEGAGGDPSTRPDVRDNTAADNKKTKSDPSTKAVDRQVPR